MKDRQIDRYLNRWIDVCLSRQIDKSKDGYTDIQNIDRWNDTLIS